MSLDVWEIKIWVFGWKGLEPVTFFDITDVWSLKRAGPIFQHFLLTFRAFGGCSELSKMFLSTCLTTVYALKPIGTPYGLDWTWFCELELSFWKTFINADFSETRYSQRKGVGLRLLFTIWFLKMFWTEIMNFSLVLLWEFKFHEKRWYETNFAKLGI